MWHNSRSNCTGSGLSFMREEDPAGRWNLAQNRCEWELKVFSCMELEINKIQHSKKQWTFGKHTISAWTKWKRHVACQQFVFFVSLVCPLGQTRQGLNMCLLEKREGGGPSSAFTTGSSSTYRRSWVTSITKATALMQIHPRYPIFVGLIISAKDIFIAVLCAMHLQFCPEFV